VGTTHVSSSSSLSKAAGFSTTIKNQWSLENRLKKHGEDVMWLPIDCVDGNDYMGLFENIHCPFLDSFQPTLSTAILCQRSQLV
jgi:hypothetical protein